MAEKVHLDYGIICPACKKETYSTPKGMDAYSVEDGSAYCCSSECAKNYEEHAKQPAATRAKYPL